METILNNIHVKFTSELFDQVRSYLLSGENQEERICYIAAHKLQVKEKIFIYPQKIYIPENDSVSATRSSVNLSHDIVGAIYRRFGESPYDVLINAHSHPFDYSNQVYFSSVDDKYDKLESEYLSKEITKVKKANNESDDFIHLSLVLGQNSLNARHTEPNGVFHTVKYVDTFGSVFNRVFSYGEKYLDSDLWNRQILAFGAEPQKIVEKIRVAVVGAGGIGSIISEGLVRLGVRDIVLIDDDILEDSNLNRWQGGRFFDVSYPKVTALGRNLLEYQEDLSILGVNTNAISQKSVDALKLCDFIFSCVDNVETRFFLNRIASRYQIPIFDTGVVVAVEEETIKTKWQSISYIPGYTRCFDCSAIRIYDKDTMCRTFFDATTAEFMRGQGYIKDKPDIKQPAVYHLNMFAASITLYEFHNYLSGFKPFSWCLSGDSTRFNEITHHFIDGKQLGGDIPIQVLDDRFVEDKDPCCTNCNVYRGTGDYWSISGFFKNNELNLEN